MLIKEIINLVLLIMVAIMICINYKLNKEGQLLSIVSLILVLISIILYIV